MTPLKMLRKVASFKLDLILIFFLICCLYLAWGGILSQTIEGEGYYYFSPTNSLFLPSGKLATLLFNYDNFPRAIYFTLEHLFKGNIQPYMTTWFLLILTITVSVYIFIKRVTKNSLTSLLASLYMGIYYTGDFQFYARGHFQWFTQRVPELIPILISLAFLYHFIDKPKLKTYLLSVVFFTLALFMTDYTTLFLPLFIAFIIVSAVLKRKNLQQKLLLASLSIPFFLINYINATYSPLSLSIIRPHQTFFQSVIENSDVPFKISHQLVVTTIPFFILKLLSNLTHLKYPGLIKLLIFPVYLFYLLVFYFFYKKKVAHFHLLVGLFFGLLGVLFLNVYLRRVNIFNEIEQGRYYFIPGIYIGIIISSFIATLLNPFPKLAKNKLKISAITAIILFWILVNVPLIWEKIRVSQYSYTAGRRLMTKLDSIRNNLPSNSIIMVPNPLMPLGEDFLKKYYNNKDYTVKFLFIDTKWKEKIPENFDINKLYVFDYSDEYKKAGRADLTRIYIDDLSKNYRDEFSRKESIDKTNLIN